MTHLSNILDLNGLCSKFTSEDVRTFHQSLEGARTAAAGDLQKNVFKNYIEFVNISQEISALESDILNLRTLLKDLTTLNGNISDQNTVLQDVEAPEPAASSTDSLSPNESKNESTSFEEGVVFKKGHIDRLYETIEGLQKVLPFSPTRYVVRDGIESRFWEVNPATFRQRQPVQIYLLNDAVIVTSKKKNMISGKTKLVVEKCLRFSEVAVIDLRDSGDITNAFKVMCHPDVFLFRSEDVEEKKQLLSNENPQSDPVESETQAAKNHAPSAAKTTNTQDFLWLKELPYELDVSIANRDFNIAVTLIERARNLLFNVQTPHAIQNHVHPLYERISQLAELISSDLANPVCTKTQAKVNIELLQRLGLEDQARDVFLISRSQALHSLIRQIKLNGEVSVYVDTMASVVFSFIRSTCDWYYVAFQNTDVASGLDLHFVLDHLFINDLLRSIDEYAKLMKERIAEEVENDNFEMLEQRPSQFDELYAEGNDESSVEPA
ncbi:exocyst complex component exo84 [Phlyctochytrium planicorne]|nr:exocyst complex component exo84 [Phlyctochytrium planicorne]